MRTSHFGRQRLTVIATSVALTAGVLAAGGGPAAAITSAATGPEEVVVSPEVLSHFLCYRGNFRPQFSSYPRVGLKDQFGRTKGRVGQASLFCNATKKRHGGQFTGIVSINDHLKGYRFRRILAVQPHSLHIQVGNQFGDAQHLRISGTPKMLLTPTQKRPHDRPKGLDHFLCYKVQEGESIDDPVKLRDQFSGYKTRVLDPIMHCNPVKKRHDGGITPIKHPEAHLVCYTIRQRDLDPPQTRKTANQFERAYIRAKTAVMLCVPSTKIWLDPGDVDPSPTEPELLGLPTIGQVGLPTIGQVVLPTIGGTS
jgi:hypothetical protein